MKTSEFRSILKTTNEFAIFPAPITARLPHDVEYANNARNLRACPTGMIQATVVEDRHKYMEKFTLGCGDQEYERPRQNGVLIEFPFERLAERWKKRPGKPLTDAIVKKTAHTKIIRRDGQKFIQMIVSVKAILAPWGEYAMIEAEREKERAERKERDERLHAAQKAVGGLSATWARVHEDYDEKTGKKIKGTPKGTDYTVSLRYSGGQQYIEHLRGEVKLTLTRSEAIGKILDLVNGQSSELHEALRDYGREDLSDELSGLLNALRKVQ